MSTILNTNGEVKPLPTLLDKDFNCLIITAEWNPSITEALRDGAISTLEDIGVENMDIVNVPGTVELVNAAALGVNLKRYSAIIVIGCVIRGDTPHFDYVCMHTAEGVAALNARGETPVIFGVLTVDNLEQAQQRAGGVLGNKGSEAAVAAVTMGNLHTVLAKG